MTLQDSLIHGREALVNGLLGVRRDAVLNAGLVESPAVPVSGGQIAAELKRAVNGLKVAALSPDGAYVDYARLSGSEAYADYRRCAALLRDFDPGSLSTREERLAFWINLYNALVIDAVIAFGIRQSVTEGRLGLLAFFRRAAYDVGGFRISCDDIEHGILRGNRGHPAVPGPHFGPSDVRRSWMVDPPDVRIHFALNCASLSCPPVGFYDAARIDAQLDMATQNFIAAAVAADMDEGRLCLSRIFSWYAGDFGGHAGVLDFVARYVPEEVQAWLLARENAVQLAYEPYDWSLNIISGTV